MPVEKVLDRWGYPGATQRALIHILEQLLNL